jgi:alkylation response protein AidB-like acyl-CoA dehydrogenase
MTSSPTRADARAVAEEAREAARTRPSFGAELFLGRVHRERMLPFPPEDLEERARVAPVLAALRKVLEEEIDPDRVDREGKIPERALERLHEVGAFRLRIPTAYGGLGFSQRAYGRAVGLVAAHCGSTAIWLSAHQSIGAPTPLVLFGTEAQKARWLPRLASGALSAFALTEPDVGSDPARMRTRAQPLPDGQGWVLDGEKLWCTNGPVADLLVVLGRTPDRPGGGAGHARISAFVVERGTPGFEVVARCEFAGYRGIENGLLRFRGVRVPAENLLGAEGQGLRLALVTLNTGRLTLPATNAAVAAECARIASAWTREREQWGGPIVGHEAVAVQVGWIASHAFAMEAVADYAAATADRGDADLRVDAALAKLFGSETLLGVVDRTLQVRGGRGYETVRSLAARGETPWPVERMWREARLNTIVEGTSEVLRLFLAREALDPHLARAGALARPGSPFLARARAFLGCLAYYPFWYARRLLPALGAPAGLPRPLRGPWRAVERGSRRLARRTLHAMLRFGPGLEHRQALLGRLVDDGADLFASAAAVSLAASRGDARSLALADLFARHANARIRARRTASSRLDRAGALLAQQGTRSQAP